MVNYPWELLQWRLYQGAKPVIGGLWHCFIAALGDGALVLLIMLLGWMLSRNAEWFLRPSFRGYMVMVGLGASVTVIVEGIALHGGRWAYREQMPVVPFVNIGLTPLIQMLVLPPLVFRLTKMLMRRKSDGNRRPSRSGPVVH